MDSALVQYFFCNTTIARAGSCVQSLLEFHLCLDFFRTSNSGITKNMLRAQMAKSDAKSGQPRRDKIGLFLNNADVTGRNLLYMRLYDLIAPVYDLAYKIYDLATDGQSSRLRISCLNNLKIRDGDKVLEIAVGTGLNFRHLPKTATYYGLDISHGMLRKCQKNLRGWDRDASLFLGQAESLPFATDFFDVVFHLGGLSRFNERVRAMEEMVRVAKPGGSLMIVDEQDKYVKKTFSKNGIHSNHSFEMNPAGLLPDGVEDIWYQDASERRLYRLTFKKALAEAGGLR